jgi:peptide/nickel transport system permease protein
MATTTATPTLAPARVEALAAETPSPVRLALRRFSRHRLAMAGAITAVFLVGYVTVGAMIYAHGICSGTGQFVSGEAFANCNDTALVLQAPSAAHPFGTDAIGRDILARTIYGGQISLTIGVTAALLEVIIGMAVGAAAGYYGGWVDSLLMRFTEAMLNIPSLFLLIVMAKFFGNKIPAVHLGGRTFSGSVVVIIVIIGLTSWMYLARIVRAEILSLKERDFVTAARSMGANNVMIIARHLIPNTLAPVIVSATLGVANSILNEAYVSFLGLGVQAPTASWGNMLDSAYKYLENAPWMWIFPGLLILLTVMSINFIGDGLRDALDPRATRQAG